MRRAALPLLLLAAAHALTNGDDAVARVTQVAAWFRGGPAPRHWGRPSLLYRGQANIAAGPPAAQAIAKECVVT